MTEEKEKIPIENVIPEESLEEITKRMNDLKIEFYDDCIIIANLQDRIRQIQMEISLKNLQYLQKLQKENNIEAKSE